MPEETLIALNADDFVTAADDTPEFSELEQAILHVESAHALVQAIVGGGAGSPVPAVPTRSLWQTASIGVRMLLDVTWAMRRVGMVSAVSGAKW